jgi:uncharacterized membrane protein/thiol-disulfide isomerase/thioredoxin
MFLKENHSGAVLTVIELVKHLNIDVTPKTIATQLKLHPNYPTLLSISDVLSQFGIANEAFTNFPVDELSIIPCPFIARTSNNGHQFVLVTAVDEEYIHLQDRKIAFDEFKEKFEGLVLAIEPLENAGDHNYKENKRHELLNSLRNPVALTGLLLIFSFLLIFHTSYFTTLSWQTGAVSLFKAFGVITSVLLLIQSIDTNNPLIQRLCQNDTNKNCSAILSSKAAKIFDWLSWSEVGFFYFAGTLLAFLFNSENIAVLQLLAVLNILCLPYTFYSIYYQARVAKQWCVFCCTVQALLWLEFFPLVTSLTQEAYVLPNIKDIAGLACCLIIPFIFWIWVKPFLLTAQKIEPLNKQINKFKYNIDLFNRLLTDQPKYVTPDSSWTVVLGNEENPDKIITMVSNPYCNPCNKAHKVLDELLFSKNNIQVRFVFMFNSAISEDDKRMVVANQLLALDMAGDKAKVKAAMIDWYTQRQKNFPEWSKTHPAIPNITITDKLEKQLDWLKLTEIKATPTILINGYKLPYPYQLTDLKYF